MSLRVLASRLGSSPPARATVSLLERALRAKQGSLHVLMYHRIAPRDERPDLHPALLSATPEAFDEQMAYLATTGRVVDLGDVVAAARGEAELRPGAILLTFDDAYYDFAEHAWPRLAARRLPATLFVPTAYPDRPDRHFWWDRLHAALFTAEPRDDLETSVGAFSLDSDADRAAARRSLGRRLQELDHDRALEELDSICEALDADAPASAVLSWARLLELHRAGVTLAPHTRSHPLLGKISLDRALIEALGSYDDLVSRFGDVPPALAYPGGSYTNELVLALEHTPIELAFTTRRGSNTVPGDDPRRLDRINVGVRSTLPLVRAQLLPVSP